MDLDETRDWLGARGQAGLLLLAVGLAIIARENRPAAAGAALLVGAVGLVAGGLLDTALERTGMKGVL